MDARQIFVKTHIGDEAVRQSTRVVQRNLRMVLVQVDGNLSVGDLSSKIGNQRLVEAALRELEDGGFIAPLQGQVLEPQEPSSGVDEVKAEKPEPAVVAETVSVPFPASRFSVLGNARPPVAVSPQPANSQFSSFGKPILPAAGYRAQAPVAAKPRDISPEREPEIDPDPEQQRPITIRRWLLGAPLGILVVLALLVLLFPYNRYKPDLEASIGQLLQAPVKIGSVGISVWPRFALNLSDIRVGEAEEAAIENMRISSPFSLIGSGPHQIETVDVSGTRVIADFLAGSALFRPLSPDENRPLIHQINLEKFTVTARDLAVRDLVGQIAFKSDGSVEKAILRNDDAGLRIEAMPAGDGIALDIHGSGWKPLGDAMMFNSMQARGMLQKGKLVIQDLDTLFLGGVLKGSWLLDWGKGGLSMAGDATLQRIDCRKLATALVPTMNLDGELGGTMRLRGSGLDWNRLWQGAEAQIDADVSRGVLHGIDIGEAVRGGRGGTLRGGTTRFDRLRSRIVVNENQVVGRDLQMSAGMMTASGQFVAARGKPLEADLLINMQTSVSSVKAPVTISGVLPNLQVVSGK